MLAAATMMLPRRLLGTALATDYRSDLVSHHERSSYRVALAFIEEAGQHHSGCGGAWTEPQKSPQ